MYYADCQLGPLLQEARLGEAGVRPTWCSTPIESPPKITGACSRHEVPSNMTQLRISTHFPGSESQRDRTDVWGRANISSGSQEDADTYKFVPSSRLLGELHLQGDRPAFEGGREVSGVHGRYRAVPGRQDDLWMISNQPGFATSSTAGQAGRPGALWVACARSNWHGPNQDGR